jgi:hypothetical protein
MTIQMQRQFSIQMKVMIVLIIMVALIAARWLYQRYIYQQNEAQGFCTAENRFISDEEMLHRVITSHLTQLFKFTSRDALARVGMEYYVSALDFREEEQIIQMMQESSVDRHFYENIAAVGYISRPSARLLQRKKPAISLDIVREKNHGLHPIVDANGNLDQAYFRSLPLNYSWIVYYGSDSGSFSIIPFSSYSKKNQGRYEYSEYAGLMRYCCDYISKEKIEQSLERLKRQNIAIKPQDFSVSLDEMADMQITTLMEWYHDVTLTTPEQVKEKGMLYSVGSFRSKHHDGPSVSAINVDACGNKIGDWDDEERVKSSFR